jgi:hypothetical protein
MALAERARHELLRRLEQVLGPASAETLMEMRPPLRWADVATKHDLAALEQRLHLRVELLEHKLLAAFRGELLSEVRARPNVMSDRTRTLVLANIGAVLSVAALAFGAARLT